MGFEIDRMAMRAGRWFKELPEDVRQEVESSVKVRRLEAGACLFRQSDAPTGLHCVLKGRVHAIGYGSGTDEKLMSILRPGDWIGFLPSLDGAPHSLSAVCAEECVTACLPIAEVRRIFERDVARFRLLVGPELRVSRRHYAYILDFHSDSPLQRLAARLIDLARGPYGVDEDAVLAVVRVSQEQLAAATQLSRQTVNVLLRRLEESGVVEVRRGSVRLVDADRLRAIAVSTA